MSLKNPLLGVLDLHHPISATFEKLRRSFFIAWNAMPLPERKKLYQYWRTRCYSPAVHVQDEFSWRFHSKDRADRSIACCGNSGANIRLCDWIVNSLPDNLLAIVICHELIHALLWSQGISPKDKGGDEVTVRRIGKSWGLDPQAVFDYIRREFDYVQNVKGDQEAAFAKGREIELLSPEEISEQGRKLAAEMQTEFAASLDADDEGGEHADADD